MSPPHKKLYKQICQYLSKEDVKDICFIMELDYENLAGSGKKGKAREMCVQLERQERTPLLLQELRELRPNVSWPDEIDFENSEKQKKNSAKHDVVVTDAPAPKEASYKYEESLLKHYINSKTLPQDFKNLGTDSIDRKKLLLAISRLGEGRCRAVSIDLASLVDDSNREIRLEAIKALGKIGNSDPRIIQKLLSAGVSKGEKGKKRRTSKIWVKKRFRCGIGWQKQWRKVPDWSTREWAVWALGQLASDPLARPVLIENAWPTLIDILEDGRNSKKLRLRAAWALGELRDKRSVVHLHQIVREYTNDPEFFETSLRATERIVEAMLRSPTSSFP